MILLVHLLLGAAIGSSTNNIPLALILAFLSHYFLDFFPHIEYPIENITKKQWRLAAPQITMVFLDFLLGILLIMFYSNNRLIVYVCAMLAIAPDGLTVLNYITPGKISKINDLVHQKIHYFKNKKIPISWRFLFQAIAALASILLLKH